jgi:hypothetical protein
MLFGPQEWVLLGVRFLTLPLGVTFVICHAWWDIHNLQESNSHSHHDSYTIHLHPTSPFKKTKAMHPQLSDN